MITKTIKKLGALIALIGIFLSLAPLSFAQEDLTSTLDDIKGKLESEGISVVDYSSPEGEWGTLPDKWIKVLQDLHYEKLQDVADKYADSFAELQDTRKQYISKEAEISHASTDKINTLNGELSDIKDTLDEEQEDIKSDLRIELGSAEGANLVFQEIDFYLNYSKWGMLPLRISNILENDYKNTQELLTDLEQRREDISTANPDFNSSEIENSLKEDIASDYPNLAPNDIELILSEANASRFYGERQLNEIIRSVASVIRNLLGGLAVIWIVVSGIRMVMAQGEESIITEQKHSLTYAVIGLGVVILIERAINILYGAPGEIRTALIPPAEAFSTEVFGVINFVRALIGTVAIFMIVLSGIKMIFAAGEEEGLTKQKRAIIWIVVGLVLIAINKILVTNFFILPVQQKDKIQTGNITTVINTFGNVLKFALGFTGIVALALLVYGAALMIANYGNDEMVEKAKKIIKNAIIGIIVIISAYTLVATLIVFK
jgi:hypothetical protein